MKIKLLKNNVEFKIVSAPSLDEAESFFTRLETMGFDWEYI